MRLSRIVVGVDFSSDSARAVEHAAMLARHVGARLTVLHAAIVPPPSGTNDVDPWVQLLRRRLAVDREGLAEITEDLQRQGVDVAKMIVDGQAEPALFNAARELGADLLIVGTHGRTGARRILLGSVAEKAIRLASSSVLVARGDAPTGGYRHVVVGTDFSEPAWRALECALEMTASGGHVHVVHAWRTPYMDYDIDGRAYQMLREAAATDVERSRERIMALPRPRGVTLGIDLIDGSPFAVLDDCSKDAQLIAVGTHGLRGERRFLLGSVSEASARHARCSVLVVR
jgi:nucleotide-binding universal stress UspA family protein